MDPTSQRNFLDTRESEDQAKKTIKALMDIVRAVTHDQEIVRWALAIINGIIEDDRSRIKLLADLQKSRVPSKQCNCINTLSSYLMRFKDDPNQRVNRDLAAHTLAQLISYRGYNKNNVEESQEAQNFLTYLLDAR